MKYIKLAGFLALTVATAALGVGHGQTHNPIQRFLEQDLSALNELTQQIDKTATHFKNHEGNHTTQAITNELEDQLTRLENYKVQLKNELAQAELATNIDTTTAMVAKKSCGSCNKPKTTCVVREKKTCGSCKPKVERPECHTCNKCHRPVAPKAKKCGSCNHKLAQELDQENVAVIDETVVEQDSQGDETITEEEVITPASQPKKSCGSCKPKCAAKKTCAKPAPAVEEVTVTEVVEDPAA
jgi:hypothetical protein